MRHYTISGEITNSAALPIAGDADAAGLYLLYLDERTCERIDTFHQSLEAAFGPARWQLNFEPRDWTRVQPTDEWYI